jgi:hypothetical protein
MPDDTPTDDALRETARIARLHVHYYRTCRAEGLSPARALALTIAYIQGEVLAESAPPPSPPDRDDDEPWRQRSG